MSVLDDTGELARIAHEVNRVNHPNRASRPIDFPLIAVVVCFGVSALMWSVLALSRDDFVVDRGRVVLTLAASASCVAPVLAAMYALNRANQRRQDDLVSRIEYAMRRTGQPLPTSDEAKDLAKRAFDMGRRIERRGTGEG